MSESTKPPSPGVRPMRPNETRWATGADTDCPRCGVAEGLLHAPWCTPAPPMPVADGRCLNCGTTPPRFAAWCHPAAGCPTCGRMPPDPATAPPTLTKESFAAGIRARLEGLEEALKRSTEWRESLERSRQALQTWVNALRESLEALATRVAALEAARRPGPDAAALLLRHQAETGHQGVTWDTRRMLARFQALYGRPPRAEDPVALEYECASCHTVFPP